MKTMKGPALFLAQFAGDAPPFNSLDAIGRWAASLGYKGVQIPTWDARLFDLKKAASSDAYCDEVKGIAEAARDRDHRTLHPPAGPARRRAPGLRRGLRRLRGAGSARPAAGAHRVGGRADAPCRAGLEAPRPERPRDLLGRARLAVRLSLAAASGGPRRDGLRRTRPPLASDPRRVRRGGLRRLLRDSSRRGHPRRRHVSSASSMRSAGTGAPASTTTRAISCCSSSTTSPSSISTTSASRPST